MKISEIPIMTGPESTLSIAWLRTYRSSLVRTAYGTAGPLNMSFTALYSRCSSIFRLHKFHSSPALLGVEITLHVAQRIRVITKPVLNQVVGFEGHVKGQVFLHVCGDFGVLQCRAIAAGDFFGERLDVTVKLLFGNDLRDEADALCFDAGEISAGERDVEGFLGWNSTVKKAGRRRGSVAPADDLRHPELCGVGSDHEIMTVDHGEAAVEVPAFNRRNRDLREFAHDAYDLGHAARAAAPPPVALVSHVIQVEP